MIKKLLTVATVVLSVAVNAQTGRLANTTNVEANNSIQVQNSSAPGCVQITTQTNNSVTINTSSPCNTVTNAFGGYVNGSNCWLDTEKANYFAGTTYSNGVTSPSISAMAVGFFKQGGRGTSGTTNTVAVNFYAGTMASGPTGASLATATASLSQIIAAQTSTVPFFTYTFTLASPVALPLGGFFAAVTTPTAAGDTVVVLSQGTSSPANYGWERESDNLWYNMTVWGAGYKANLSMYPLICGSNITVGVSKNLGLSKDVTIMPNPSTGLVNVAVALANSQDLSLTVTNALGQVVVSNKYNAVLTENISLDLTNQANGVYFVTVSNGTDKMVQRLILNK